MRWLVLLAVACSSKKDCEIVAAKVRPVIKHMIADAGKTITDAELDTITAEYCAKPPVSAEDKAARDCILAATSEVATAACLEPEFKAYRDDTAASLERSKQRMAELDAEREKLDREARAIPDAAPTDAAIDARPAVEAATLPEWPVPAGVHGSGPEVEVDAVDTDVDRLLMRLWDPALPLIAPSKSTTITGRVVAPSRAAAFAALAARVGFTPPKLALHGGKGESVTFSFAGARVRDLFRVIADVLHANVVVTPGELPSLNVSLDRVPADAALAAFVAAIDRTVVRSGKIIYITDKGATLPPLPKLSGPSVSLGITDGTAADAVAAIAAVTKFDVSACGGPATVNLRLRNVPLAEVARAIELASGVTLTPGATCPLAEAKLDDNARLVAVATAGAKSAAVVRQGTTSKLVRDVTATGFEVRAGDTTLVLGHFGPPPTPANADAFVAALKRTSAVMRIGKTWAAVVETATAPVVFEPHSYSLPLELISRYTISAKGVEVPLDPEHPTVIPLAK